MNSRALRVTLIQTESVPYLLSYSVFRSNADSSKTPNLLKDLPQSIEKHGFLQCKIYTSRLNTEQVIIKKKKKLNVKASNCRL